jgi:hypothetical protein
MTTFVRRPRGRNNLRPNGRRPNNNFRNGASGGQIVSLGEPGNSNSFGRNRNNNGGRNTGNILKLLEKYRTLANDALASGDIILAESYFQHADHFVRQLPEQKTPVVTNDSNANDGTDEPDTNTESEEIPTTDNQDLDLSSNKENIESLDNTLTK